MTSDQFQRTLLDELQGMSHIVVNRQVVEQTYTAEDRSAQEQFTEACQTNKLTVSIHTGTGNYLVAWQRPVACYYCGSHAHQDNPCPVRQEDAERYASTGQVLYPKLTQ